MLYSDSENAWLDWRAEKIADERGWPLPIAPSEACAELVRMQTRKPAVVQQFARDPSPFADRYSIAETAGGCFHLPLSLLTSATIGTEEGVYRHHRTGVARNPLYKRLNLRID